MTITASRLNDLGACRSQVAAFKAIWGDGPAPMTVDAAVENADTFSWDWAARHLLTPDNCAEFDLATAQARAEYDRVELPAWAEYKRAEAEAWLLTTTTFSMVEATAWAEYERVMGPAYAEYKRACAPVFATIYIKQEAAA